MARRGKKDNRALVSSGGPLADLSRYVAIPVAKLRKAPWNYKTDDPHKAESLTRGISKRGQIVNLIVRELPKGLYEVVNGNHRLDSMLALEAKEAVAYNLGPVGVEEAQLVAVETNDLAFQNDELKFAQTIASIATKFTVDQIAETTAIPVQQVTDFMEMLKFDFSQFTKAPDPADPNASSIGEQYRTVLFRMPKDVAKQFEVQLARAKRIMFPDQPAADVPDVNALVKMVDVFTALSDKEIARLGGVVRSAPTSVVRRPAETELPKESPTA